MRNFDAGIKAQLEAGELRPFILISLAVGSGYYYTDCDVPLVYDGNRYEPHAFDLSAVNYSLGTVVDTCTLGLDDCGEDLKSDFIGGDPQGSQVVVRMVVLDVDYAIIGPAHVTWFDGEIGEWEYEEGTISMTVTNMFARWNMRTQSRHPASCRWKKFKGTECTYSGGESWCDRSYTRCEALGNQANFGGFRWLPSIENANIWWGSAPKE